MRRAITAIVALLLANNIFSQEERPFFHVIYSNGGSQKLTIDVDSKGLVSSYQSIQSDNKGNILIDVTYQLIENEKDYLIRRTYKGITTDFATIQQSDGVFIFKNKKTEKECSIIKGRIKIGDDKYIEKSNSSIIIREKRTTIKAEREKIGSEMFITSISSTPQIEGSYVLTRIDKYTYILQLNNDTGESKTEIKLKTVNLDDSTFLINYLFLSLGNTDLDLLPFLAVCE